MSKAYEKHFGQLVGCKIVGFHMEKDEYEMGDWPVLVVQMPNSSNFSGQKFNVILSQDEEGNGGGFAFIEDYI